MARCGAVPLLAALLVLSSSSSAAQTDLRDALLRCTVISAPSGRLVCYDSLTKALTPITTPQAGVGAWQVSDKTNPLDDSRTVTLDLAATSGRSVYGKPIVLVLRCQSHKTEVFIGWGSYLGEEAKVTTRVGSGESKTKNWGVSTDHTATFYHSDPVAFIQELMAADRFVAQVIPYNESPITAVFDLTGLQTAVKPLRDDCAW